MREALESMGHTVVALPGVAISKGDVVDAEALFVRTRTCCDASLLAGTSVKFIGTATIGYDHIDADFCAANGIKWASAAGCNAGAVLQYVQSVVYLWASERGISLEGLTLGVVGVGEIGSRVAHWAASEGIRVLLNDPPREEVGGTGFVSLERIAAESDIITLHPTLNKGGKHPSLHLVDDAFLASLQRCRLFINASRGPVVDNRALLRALESNPFLDAVLDVWEGEPDINISLLNKVYIATPHIAGYSVEGKINATTLVLEAFARFFSCSDKLPVLAPPPVATSVSAPTFASAVLKIYDPRTDSIALKQTPSLFEDFRNNYNLRREVTAYDIKIG